MPFYSIMLKFGHEHETSYMYTEQLIQNLSDSVSISLSSTDLLDVMRKSFLKDILENWSDFLVDIFVLSLSGSKVSQLIASCHLKHNMT